MEGIREVKLDDQDWGEIKILISIPKPGEPWGVLAPLKDTPWGKLIPEVTGEAMSHALHGYALPLMREIGRKPENLPKRLEVIQRECASSQDKSCGAACEKCMAGSGEVPFCYEAPTDELKQRRIANHVVLSWNDNRYVVVVVGEEFSF